MATLYFIEPFGDWNVLANWYQDAAGLTPATALPGPSDDVVLMGYVGENSGPAIVVNSILVSNGAVLGVFGSVTVANGVTADGYSGIEFATVNGDVTFNGNSLVGTGLTVTGTVTLNDYSAVYNDFTVGGAMIFNDVAGHVGGTITGSPVFNDTSRNGSVIIGDPVFNGTADNGDGVGGTVQGNPTFNNSAYNSGTCTNGLATFNDESYNIGAVYDAVFNDTSYNVSNVDGNAWFNDTSSQSGSVNGTASFTLQNAEHQMRQGFSQNASSIEFRYDKGINGSSILGIV